MSDLEQVYRHTKSRKCRLKARAKESVETGKRPVPARFSRVLFLRGYALLFSHSTIWEPGSGCKKQLKISVSFLQPIISPSLCSSYTRQSAFVIHDRRYAQDWTLLRNLRNLRKFVIIVMFVNSQFLSSPYQLRQHVKARNIHIIFVLFANWIFLKGKMRTKNFTRIDL